jgi:Tol biopolymer transport system component
LKGGRATSVARRTSLTGGIAALATACALLLAPPAHATFPGQNGKIAFGAHGLNYLGDLYTINPDGSELMDLTGPDPGRSPSWSADGRKIAFTDGPCSQVSTINSDGTNVTQLTSSSSCEIVNQDPSWSPNGREIAFASNRDGNYEIYKMNSDGSEQTS